MKAGGNEITFVFSLKSRQEEEEGAGHIERNRYGCTISQMEERIKGLMDGWLDRWMAGRRKGGTGRGKGEKKVRKERKKERPEVRREQNDTKTEGGKGEEKD